MDFSVGETVVAIENEWNEQHEEHLAHPLLCRVAFHTDGFVTVFANGEADSIKICREWDIMSLNEYANWMQVMIKRNADKRPNEKWMVDAYECSVDSIRGCKGCFQWTPCVVLNGEMFPSNFSFLESVPVADTEFIRDWDSSTRYGRCSELLDFRMKDELFKVNEIEFYAPKSMHK